MTTRTLPRACRWCARAEPMAYTVFLSSGYSPAAPRIPSVPNSFRKNVLRVGGYIYGIAAGDFARIQASYLGMWGAPAITTHNRTAMSRETIFKPMLSSNNPRIQLRLLLIAQSPLGQAVAGRTPSLTPRG